MTLELPGFNRQINKQADISGKYENANHTIKEGYMILQVNDSYYASTKITNLIGAQPVKRCNTIAQELPPAKVGHPAPGFVQSGTSVTGAAWSNLTVYGATKKMRNGVAWIDNPALAKKMKVPLIDSVQMTYPGAPYVGWNHGPGYYANETSINLSTVPLPTGACPNPEP